ncbi:MAG: VanZ family protein [Firmicutes bacterium]|nr:VanZ family protein [Bacillota bacterium]
MGIAAIDEFIQYFVPGRAMMFTDWLIDSFGVIIGVIVVKLIVKYIEKNKQDQIK